VSALSRDSLCRQLEGVIWAIGCSRSALAPVMRIGARVSVGVGVKVTVGVHVGVLLGTGVLVGGGVRMGAVYLWRALVRAGRSHRGATGRWLRC